MNTFFTVFHKFDVSDSEEKLRYKLGFIMYMVNFYVQCFILLATTIYAFVLYIRLYIFLKPKPK